MADLKDIKGTNVQSVEGNPTNPLKGELWYNLQLELQEEKYLLLQLGQQVEI